MNEIQRIRKVYNERNKIDSNRYAIFSPDVYMIAIEKKRKLLEMLKTIGYGEVFSKKILEIGCGTGGNIIELQSIGFLPKNIIGNELLHDNVVKARVRLHQEIQLIEGDASELDFPGNCFDIVFQSTVFTSVLDREFQHKLAMKMWNWVKPEGGILWYDFIYNNPNNPEVRGIPVKRIQELFPEGKIYKKKITLAPPISRFITKIHPSLYTFFNVFPFLRTHVLCWIAKK